MDSVVARAVKQHRKEDRKDGSGTAAPNGNGQIHDSPAASREEMPRFNTQTSYFRSNHNSEKPPKRKQQSGSSAFTSGSLEEDDVETPGREIDAARPFRGPFKHNDSHRAQEATLSKLPNGKTTPQGTPAERRSALPETTSTPVSPTPSADRPTLNTRTTSAAFFFNRLSSRTPAAPNGDMPGPIERPMETLAEDEPSTPQVQTPRAPLSPTTSISGRSFLGRSRSGDQLSTVADSPSGPPTAGSKGWTVLKNRMKASDHKGIEEISKALSGHELVSELTTGLLPVMMLKMGLTDRDEHGERRIPVSSAHAISCIVLMYALDPHELPQAPNHRLGVSFPQHSRPLSHRATIRRRSNEMGHLPRNARFRQSTRSLPLRLYSPKRYCHFAKLP